MTSPAEDQILVLAPLGRDASLIVSTLTRSGVGAIVAKDLEDLCERILDGVGAAILTEEALHGPAINRLSEVLACQEPWSDVPLIILTTGGEARATVTWDLVKRLEAVGNVSLLERPLRSMTLVSTVQVALRSRRRQYEVRSLYEDLERRVAERTAELQRMNDEAEGFSYSISHDLRTPLRAIGSTSRMLLEDFAEQLPAAAAEKLRRQDEAANRLAKLIDDLLRLSRLSRQEMKVTQFDISELAREVAQEIQERHGPTACVFQVQEGLTATGDELLVRFVLLNLLQNACKFSPEGVTVAFGQREDGAFFVRDEGIGFDMAYAPKLFLPFERLVRDDQFPGTGIGLANVKRIVDRHRGHVWAESSPGSGATFWFTLTPTESR